MVEAKWAGAEMNELREAPNRLEAQLGELRAQVKQMSRELASARAMADEELATALARQRIELTGSQEEREALLAEVAKEERIELLRRQVCRRIKFGGLANGWMAWKELRDARSYALKRLREIGNRLHRPELSFAFGAWGELLEEKLENDRKSQFTLLQEREAALSSRCARLEKEVERERAAGAAQLEQAAQDKASALKRQLTEMTGTAEEIDTLRKQEAKEERVELLRRQVGRRMLYSSLAHAWTAWAEFWSAKTYSMARLKQCGNKLKTPALATSFAVWAADTAHQKKEAAWRELEAQSNSLEAKLRQSRYESKQMSMIQTAQADELTALRAEVRDLTEERTEREAKLLKYDYLAGDIDKLKAMQAKAVEEAREAKQKREEAEADVLKQLDSSQQLLEKLLAEQRVQFANASKDLRARLESESEMRRAVTSDLQRLQQQSEDRELSQEAEASRLRDEVKRLKGSPKPARKPKPVKTGIIDLDEGPDAPPISEQLAAALKTNATRVLDLFRSWDANGDGQVSRAEFHRAMAELGLEVPKENIDQLFSEWDKDGGGELGYNELRKILQAPRTPSSPAAKLAEAGAEMKVGAKLLGKLKKK